MQPLASLGADWAALASLLDEALARPAAERGAWLDALPATSAAHRETLRALLATQAEIETGDFLDKLPTLSALPELRTPAGDAGDGAVPGALVGPYRLVSELGRGGMGSVWVAERADGALRRRVALKLPRIAWGDAFEARLERERDILATLAHPHIARLYDAGTDARGRPWIALELVEGRPIDAFVRERALGLDARLALLLQVMDAVAYAHRRLVVHRDLKPANVLVTADGQVRLLDFGIAKLLDDGRAPSTALTERAGRALTLDHASPEQIRGEPLGTATDVYSLGVVAFELLAGTRPYRLRRGTAAELEEAIAAVEPPLASAVASDPAIAKRLRGDLDAILNRALKKDPAERYPTVDAFAADLRRHRAGEPVEARPDAWTYRASRFVRRHRAPVAAASLAAVALVAGSGVALWQASEARAEARRAATEAATARAVQGFLEGVFAANRGDQANAGDAREATARQLLDRGAARIDTELAGAPAARLRLLGTLASMYEDLGVPDAQLALQRKRLALARATTGPASDATVRAMADTAHALTTLEQRDEARALLAEAAAALDAKGDATSSVRQRVFLVEATLALREDPARGLAAATRAVALARRGPPSAELVVGLQQLGANAIEAGKPEEARVALAEAVGLVEGRPELGASARSYLLGLLGNAERDLGRFADADAHYRASLELVRQQRAEPDEVHFAEMVYANFLYDQGRFRQSAEIVAPAARWARATSGDAAVVVPMSIAAEGRVQLALGHPADALAAIDAARERAAALQAPDLDVPLQSYRAHALVELGRLADARAALDAGRALVARDRPELARHLEPVERRLGVAEGRAPEVFAALRAARAARGATALPAPTESIGSQAEFARFALEAGDLGSAEAAARGALDAIAREGASDYRRDHAAVATLVLGEALRRTGRAAEGCSWLAQAAGLARLVFDATPHGWRPRAEAALRRCPVAGSSG